MGIKQLLSFFVAGALVAMPHVAVAQEYTQEQIDSGEALQDMSKKAFDNAMARLPESGEGCTKQNVRIRKEWRQLSKQERINYTNALQCLMSQTESVYDDAPGARSTWDDFGVLHYRLTPQVHNSATFLLFHRYYGWALEDHMRSKCGFEGDMPYWEWGLDCDAPHLSPMFDGSEESMGSDGEPQSGGFSIFGGGGTGGGCLMKGPFANNTVNLGPVGSRDPLVYNPRCISRDLNGGICARYASLRNTTDAILDSPDIELFQAIVQGDSRYPESRNLGLAVHGGGHFIISGDPGGDFYFSPLEPAFYQHHGQIDRMYFIWQNLDWENRQNIAGTGTMMNMPPSPEVEITESLDLSPLAPPAVLKDLIDTAGGAPYCFVYQ